MLHAQSRLFEFGLAAEMRSLGLPPGHAEYRKNDDP